MLNTSHFDCSALKADPERMGPSRLAICNMYTKLVDDEQAVLGIIRRSENEVSAQHINQL